MAVMTTTVTGAAQTESSATITRRTGNIESREQPRARRVAEQPSTTTSNAPQADIEWSRTIYRVLDLDMEQNAPLRYPDEPAPGEDNLFSLIMSQVLDGELNVYEYLDGREDFSENHILAAADILDRYHIPYTTVQSKGRNKQTLAVESSDLPTNEILSYYIIERWEFDRRNTHVRTYVEAICPVLHREDDFGGTAIKYPMFWVRYADLQPSLRQHFIFVSDDNNLPTHTFDDYFRTGIYKGEIYKTRNLRNLTLGALHPDAEDLAHARDSIESRLSGFEANLWVPDPEEAEVAADSTAVSAQETPSATKNSRNARRKPAAKNRKPKSISKTASSASRSVRNRRK